LTARSKRKRFRRALGIEPGSRRAIRLSLLTTRPSSHSMWYAYSFSHTRRGLGGRRSGTRAPVVYMDGYVTYLSESGDGGAYIPGTPFDTLAPASKPINTHPQKQKNIATGPIATCNVVVPICRRLRAQQLTGSLPRWRGFSRRHIGTAQR
jgi:hypothetical protein